MPENPGRCTVGDIYDPLGLQQAPWDFYAKAREEDPVFYSPKTKAYMVTKYADARTVLDDVGTFSLAGILRVMEALNEQARGVLLEAFPPFSDADEPGDDARLRAREPIRQAFTPDRVRSMDNYLNTQISGLVDEFDLNRPVDLMGMIGRPLPIRGKSDALGLEQSDLPAMIDGAYALSVLSTAGSTLDADTQLSLARRVVPYQQLLRQYVEERIQRRGTDLISQVIDAIEQTPHTPTQSATTRTAVETLVALIGAGQSTTTSSFALAVFHLLQDRALWRRLGTDTSAVEPTVEEMLRFDSPIQALTRRTTCPVSLSGVNLPAGSDVMVVFPSANRDEAIFATPHSIDPDRSPNPHLSFGHGSRSCVGMFLARRLLQISVSQLAIRYPDMRLRHGPASLELWPGMHRLVRSLDVEW